jgi:hypothetical protein
VQKNSFRGPSLQRTILFMIGAAKEGMPSGFGPECADPPLAAGVELAENSRLGSASRNPARHRGIAWSKSTLALGLPEWSGKTASDPVVGPTDQGGQQTQCMDANVAAVNRVSNLNVTSANVTDSFSRNGAWNYDFSVPGATPGSLAPQRYSSSVFNAITGIGPSLHVPAPGGTDPSVYGISGGNFTFTTHIDSAYATWHTPIGAFLHWFIDVRDQGSHRKPC